MPMDFKKATDELLWSFSHTQLAKELGVSVPSVRQARLDAAAKAHRSAPDGWEVVIARLAEQRANALLQLSKRLQKAKKQSGNQQ